MNEQLFASANQAFADACTAEKFHGYGPRPIPHELDSEVEAFIRSYEVAQPSERASLQLPEFAGSVLLAFAERQASLAVRIGQAPLNLSIFALALAVLVANDERAGIAVMSLPWHAAKVLGLKPKAVFAQVAAVVPLAARNALLAFARRSASDQTLECMGYIEGNEGSEFRYVRAW